MAVKKSNLAAMALLLALTVTTVSESFANAENNNLVQLDLKRASNNAVDVTLFTSGTYNDNVLVRKKSDNKYVILIPKIQSHGYSSSSLTGVNDLVSNIDVKTVNDTSGGYTKVTLITTKPLDIKTSTQKSSPVTSEQKEYKTLIAQANVIKSKIGQDTSATKTKQKTEVTVNKSNITPKTATSKNTVKNINHSNIVTKTATQTKAVKQSSPKPSIKLEEINPQNIERQTRKEQLAELIQEVKQENLENKVPQENISNTTTVAGTTFNEPIQDIKELPVQEKTSILTLVKNKLSSLKLPKPIKYGLLPLLCLIFLVKFIKASFRTTQELKEAFIENLAKNSPILNTVKYNNIVNNSELSWQEKYQRYLDASAKPVPRANNKGHYTFIKTPAELPSKDIEEKRNALEKMISDTVSANVNNINPEIVEVVNDEDAIQKTIKFKAFDKQKTSLNMTSRDKIKSRFKKYENEIPLHEQKNIELGNSVLHTSSRRLKNANLDIADVENRGRRMKFKPTEYIMSSIDEFFSIIDKEKAAKENINKATNPIVSSNINQTQTIENITQQKIANGKVNNPIQQTNPITKLRNETKSSYINGLIVKSGFNIDENKGFYIVNLDGKSALIGKVNEEVFVLKRFDTNITDPIKVRHDNANVYMVKAGGFKSLVEVNNEKMGVLIEL